MTSTTTPPSNALETLHRIRTELKARFIERDAIIDGALAAMLAGEHILMLGPVGTAKSMLAVELCQRLRGGAYFGWLLTKFSTPEELFGAISVRALEEDRYERVTKGKLPEAHIAFLDEIFKANSAILNSLLSLINERVYHNGQSAQPVPLITMFAASNELPEEGELQALFDRFMLRFTVEYIEEDFRFLKMLTLPEAPTSTTTLELDDLQVLRRARAEVVVDELALGDLVELRRRLNKKGIINSDRRYRRCIALMQAYALLEGRDRVTAVELQHLTHALWNDPTQREEVNLTIQEIFHGHEDEGKALLLQAREVQHYALKPWDDIELAMRAGIEAHTKLKRIHSKVEDLVTNARKKKRRLHALEQILDEVESIQRQLLAEGV